MKKKIIILISFVIVIILIAIITLKALSSNGDTQETLWEVQAIDTMKYF